MKNELSQPGASVHVPSGEKLDDVLERTTHLAIGAHPDDLEIFAMHGIGQCHGSETKHFTGVVVTDGRGSARKGQYEHYTDDQMVEARKAEQFRAADKGKYNAQFMLGYADKAYNGTEIRDDLVRDIMEILHRTKPEVLYLHNVFDKHPGHLATVSAALEAVRHLPPEERPKEIYGCEVWRGLDWLPYDKKEVLDVTPYLDLQRELINCHDSQITGSKNYTESTIGRELANATYLDTHALQEAEAVNYAVDLMPLIRNPNLTLEQFKTDTLHHFMQDTLVETERFELEHEPRWANSIIAGRSNPRSNGITP